MRKASYESGRSIEGGSGRRNTCSLKLCSPEASTQPRLGRLRGLQTRECQQIPENAVEV
jgi:hypothetical protein